MTIENKKKSLSEQQTEKERTKNRMKQPQKQKVRWRICRSSVTVTAAWVSLRVPTEEPQNNNIIETKKNNDRKKPRQNEQFESFSSFAEILHRACFALTGSRENQKKVVQVRSRIMGNQVRVQKSEAGGMTVCNLHNRTRSQDAESLYTHTHYYYYYQGTRF